MTRKAPISAHGVTHAGLVRSKNEDCFLADAELGLYVVLDGMGGHNAGDVASSLAREVIGREVRAGRGQTAPAELLDAAMQAAAAAVHAEAQRDRDLIGMGTTVVACYLVGERRAIVAHVGDSRAYVLQGGRMRLCTRDHTVVAELLARGALAPSEAAVHPYKSVLSRNLGGRSDARVDLCDLELEPGDRVLLCSDGLSGYASHEAMEQILAGVEDADRAAAELVELALRGGGGDNVTALVVEVSPSRVRDSAQELRRAAAAAWWSRRAVFAAEAKARGVHESAIAAVLPPSEALAVLAGNLCEAVFHDLELAAGLHVWTFAESLATGWIDQGGPYAVLRDLLDRLRDAGLAVVADVGASDARLAVALETELLRALIVAEMAVAAALGERMRRLEQILVNQRAPSAPVEADEQTVELSGPFRFEPPTPMVAACLERAWQGCRQPGESGAPQLTQVIDAAHRAALDPAPELDLAPLARELVGSRALTDAALRPLLDSLGRGRERHLEAVREMAEAPSIRAAALFRLAAIHEGLMSAVAQMVVEAAAAVTERLVAADQTCTRLRGEAARCESRLTRLERKLAARSGSSDPPFDPEATVTDAPAAVAAALLADDLSATWTDGEPVHDPTIETQALAGAPGEGAEPVAIDAERTEEI